mmetsp:Transcript_6336/g.10454  ORF Transcript_6336/g.10454 Transcript_6336/m.10454 type:complete len:524 (+) Transcript_6336:98-1669(+)|eukprot:CAMPEP_0197039590 /NCGR_PEP_ID=MMETSP1384-20130603/16354_1 /TAXON_ID=29189 /ORGANISM="Ammonia sp." /LENGTH=523 /DNA_ID=CAMNT_0042470207 /DNA_START=76 /DNA_END=1647 /DNA_ORIENTATION=+
MKLYFLPVFFAAIYGEKADVADEIAADTLGSCSTRIDNCMASAADGATTNYSPNTITFEGITVSEDGYSCCYNYKSVKTDRLDCSGKSPAQSHWVLQSRFDDCTFKITSTTPDNNVGFGSDKSTCMEGIKFDVGCEDSTNGCEYQVCLDFCNFGGGLTADACCTKEGWALTKSGTTYDFTSIEVPSCVCESESVCETDVSLNIAFLLDESGSIDENEWEIVTDFVSTVIDMDLADNSYVALYEYASLAAFQKLLDFTAVPATDRTSISDVLRNNRYNSGGQTYTWDAVSRVLDDFWDYKFSCTDGCETRADLLFVITDGAPTDEVCPKMVNRLQQTDIDVVVIVVGEGGNGDVDWYSAISCLDVNDNGNDIFMVPDFAEENFNAIQQRIRAKTCENTGGATPSGRPEANTEWNYEQECYCGGEGLGPVPERPANEGPCAGSGGSCDQAKNDLLEVLFNDPIKGKDATEPLAPTATAWWNVYALGFMSCYAIAITAVLCIFMAVKCMKKKKTVHEHEEIAVSSD